MNMRGGAPVDMTRNPLESVPPSRHPFQIWAFTACFIAGGSSVFDIGRPSTLQVFLPTYMVILWGWVLMCGGIGGVLAAYWKDRVTGLLMERLALMTIGLFTLIYGGVLIYVGRSPAIPASSFLLSVAVASFWRTVHVRRELKTLTRWIEEHFD